MEKSKQLKYIAIAGNIGAGKTTLARKLSHHFGWEVMYEDVEDNPYLQDFYKDMPRWSFNLQVYFLNSRYKQIRTILEGDKTVIQDRTIFEDAYIFAPNLYEMGLMHKRDFENYIRLFRTLNAMLEPPSLLIYLKADIDTLVNQIKKRGRDYEDNIRVDYLGRLNDYYNNWINNYKHDSLLVINVNEVDFADNPAHLQYVIEQVESKMDFLMAKAH